MASKLPNWAVMMRDLRLSKKMSVKALEEASGISHGTIERMEDGEAPNLHSVELVAKALGLTLADFFKNDV